MEFCCESLTIPSFLLTFAKLLLSFGGFAWISISIALYNLIFPWTSYLLKLFISISFSRFCFLTVRSVGSDYLLRLVMYCWISWGRPIISLYGRGSNIFLIMILSLHILLSSILLKKSILAKLYLLNVAAVDEFLVSMIAPLLIA